MGILVGGIVVGIVEGAGVMEGVVVEGMVVVAVGAKWKIGVKDWIVLVEYCTGLGLMVDAGSLILGVLRGWGWN